MATYTIRSRPSINDLVFKGTKTAYHAKRISESKKGKSNGCQGQHWITDGTNSKRQNKILPIPEGWYKGRVMSK